MKNLYADAAPFDTNTEMQFLWTKARKEPRKAQMIFYFHSHLLKTIKTETYEGMKCAEQ